MVYIVISAILVLLAVVCFVIYLKNRGGDESSGYHEDRAMTSRIAGFISLGLLAIVVVWTALGSFYNQGEGVAVVKVSFTGQVVGVTTSAGLHSQAPWDGVVEYNIRNQAIEMFNNDGGLAKDGASISAPLSGGANATVSVTVLYSIKPDSVESVYKAFGSQDALLDSALKPGLRNIVREASANYEPLAIKQERAALGVDVQKALVAAWEKYGVVVEQVNLGDISLDASTEEAISRVIQAQQQVEESRANLEKAQIVAETTKTEAQAAADADQIIRCGASVDIEIKMVNGKETEVKVIKPKSIKECENRLNEQVLTTKWYDTLLRIGENGNTIVIIPEDGTAPIINLPTSK
jgi:regulator of protease activity HflC (stomatin/prohibitin superfamily)